MKFVDWFSSSVNRSFHQRKHNCHVNQFTFQWKHFPASKTLVFNHVSTVENQFVAFRNWLLSGGHWSSHYLEDYISACKNYFFHQWKQIFLLVKTLVVVVIGSLVFLSEKAGFDVVQTDFFSSREICFFVTIVFPLVEIFFHY